MSVDATLQPWEPLPFVEAADFFRAKVPLTPSQFNHLVDEVKPLAFAVSGVAKEAALTDVFNAMQKAVEDGTSFGDFKKDIRAVIESRGWTGQRAWRVDTIFRNNIQAAYNVGKWRQIQEARDAIDYLMYDAVGDGRTRPTHAALDGKVFPKGDAFWDVWFPPNGHRCRCTVRALSEAEVKARGLTKSTGESVLGMPIEVGPGRDQVLLPDPGWGHNPGRTFFGELKVPSEGRRLPDEMEGLLGPDHYRRRAARNLRAADLMDLPEEKLLPGDTPEDVAYREFRSVFGLSEARPERIVVDGAGASLVVSDAFVRTPWGALKLTNPDHVRFIRCYPEMLTKPDEVWLTPMRYRDGHVELRRRYVRVFKTPDKKRVGVGMILEFSGRKWVGTTAFGPRNFDYVDSHLRRGVLLHARN